MFPNRDLRGGRPRARADRDPHGTGRNRLVTFY
jgi:hypothetical protein